MKTLKRNLQTLYYCQYSSTGTAYDEYEHEAEQYAMYSSPVLMVASVSPATGQSDTEMFGNLEDYDKVIVTDDLSCPITETSVLFIDKVPNLPVTGQTYEPEYNYIVKRVSKSINSISIAVSKVNVS